MGSNRKLLLGALLLGGALVVWGIVNVVGNIGKNLSTTPSPSPIAKEVNRPNSDGKIARAAVNIPQGAIITKEMMEMSPLLGGGAASGFITNPETQAIGYITRVRLSKGDQIRPADDFVGHISEVGIAGALRPGMRAIVIPVANKPTLHDLVHIGNFVDVNAAFDGQEARTIVDNVRVLAVDVFGSDFPQTNIAPRGPFKADAKGSEVAPAPGPPGGPIAAATPSPTQAPSARPDPAITLEVTPAQANRILLAQASGGVIDFVILPALSSEDTVTPSIDQNNPLAPEIATVSTSTVTKAQLAPYAERKKTSGAKDNIRTVSSLVSSLKGLGSVGKSSPTSGRYPVLDLPRLPAPYKEVKRIETFNPGTENLAPLPPQTYDIPIYADGKTVRIETVRRPEENKENFSMPPFSR